MKSRSSVKLAGDVRCEPGLAVPLLDDGDDVGDPLVLRVGEDDGQNRRVLVGRDEDLAARVEIAGDPLDRAATTDFCMSVRTRAANAASVTSVLSDRTTMTSSIAFWGGSRASMSSCALVDSG